MERQRSSPAARTSRIVRLHVWHRPEAAIRLFCFPYAGAGIIAYSRWPAVMAPRIEVATFQLPGREDRIREPAPSRLEDIVGPIADAVQASTIGPFAFFGHSLGALVAFELTRELRRRSAPGPVHLFASGRIAPHLVEAAPPLHRLSDADLLRQLRRLGGTPGGFLDDPELLRLLLPGLRADLAMDETYRFRPGPPLDTPLTAFGGTGDVRASPGGVAAWRVHTSRRFYLCMLPGDHFFVAARLPDLAAMLSAELTENGHGC